MTKEQELEFTGRVYSSKEGLGDPSCVIFITNVLLTVVWEKDGVCRIKYQSFEKRKRGERAPGNRRKSRTSQRTAWITRENLDQAMQPVDKEEIARLIEQNPYSYTSAGEKRPRRRTK